jgi:hypothetical protein
LPLEGIHKNVIININHYFLVLGSINQAIACKWLYLNKGLVGLL